MMSLQQTSESPLAGWSGAETRWHFHGCVCAAFVSPPDRLVCWALLLIDRSCLPGVHRPLSLLPSGYDRESRAEPAAKAGTAGAEGPERPGLPSVCCAVVGDAQFGAGNKRASQDPARHCLTLSLACREQGARARF